MLETMRKHFKKRLFGPFLWMGFNCLKATELLRGNSLLVTIQFAGDPGTQMMYLRSVKYRRTEYLMKVIVGRGKL